MPEEQNKKQEAKEVSTKTEQMERELPDEDLESLSGGRDKAEHIDMPYMI